MATTTTSFGPAMIGKPTPAWATNIFRIALYTFAVIGIVLSTFVQIPAALKAEILTYSGEGVVLIHALSKMFGITISNDPTAS